MLHMQILPYRLILHEQEAKLPHLDIFLYFPHLDYLYTYELSYKFWSYYQKQKKIEKSILFLRIYEYPQYCSTSFEKQESFFLLTQKKKHRRLYWSYVGSITRNRGKIQELEKSFIYISNYNSISTSFLEQKSKLYLQLFVLKLI